MTIVAGFPGFGVSADFPKLAYVVLGADSEEVANAITSSVRKIETIDKGECKCLLAGAGNGDFIDLAIQQIRNELTPPYTLPGVRGQIEEIVTNIYSDRIDHYPAHQQDDLMFMLMGAIWVSGSEDVQLIRIRRALSLVLTKPTTIGVGSDLAQYIISNLHFSSMYGYPATRLAVYLLAQIKNYVPDCGGSSQVMVLDGHGNVTELWPLTILQHELSTSVVMDGAAKWLFYFADPMGFGYDIAKVDEVIDSAALQIKSDIRHRICGIAATTAIAEASPSPLPPEDTATEKTSKK